MYLLVSGRLVFLRGSDPVDDDDDDDDDDEDDDLLGQWLNLKLFGITYLVGKISRSNFFFQGPLAEWDDEKHVGYPRHPTNITKHFRYPKWRVETEPYSRLFWGVGFPVSISRNHTAYIGEDSSILGTWNVWWKYLVSIGVNEGFWMSRDTWWCTRNSIRWCIHVRGKWWYILGWSHFPATVTTNIYIYIHIRNIVLHPRLPWFGKIKSIWISQHGIGYSRSTYFPQVKLAVEKGPSWIRARLWCFIHVIFRERFGTTPAKA